MSMRDLIETNTKTASTLHDSVTPQELRDSYFRLIYDNSDVLVKMGLGEAVYLGGWCSATLWELPNGYRALVKDGSLS